MPIERSIVHRLVDHTHDVMDVCKTTLQREHLHIGKGKLRLPSRCTMCSQDLWTRRARRRGGRYRAIGTSCPGRVQHLMHGAKRSATYTTCRHPRANRQSAREAGLCKKRILAATRWVYERRRKQDSFVTHVYTAVQPLGTTGRHQIPRLVQVVFRTRYMPPNRKRLVLGLRMRVCTLFSSSGAADLQRVGVLITQPNKLSIVARNSFVM
jgi:hypothetical protein